MEKYNREELVSKYKEFLMPQVHTSYEEPLCLEKGEGEYLFDYNGKKYLDFYTGIMVVISGHCNKKITKAVAKQIEKLQHSKSLFINRPWCTYMCPVGCIFEFVKLIRKIPAELKRNLLS